MIRHHLAAALRNFRRRPVNTAIKFLALALGLACLLTAHVIGDYFRHTDDHWANARRIHVVFQETERPGGDWATAMHGASPATPRYLRADMPELEATARMFLASMQVRRPGGNGGAWGLFVDPEFTDIFDLDLVAGQATLDRPESVLISESAARSLFGDEDPVGQTVTVGMQAAAAVKDATVRGVFRDIPASSHLGGAGLVTLDVFGSFDIWQDIYLQASPPGAPIWWEQDNFLSTNFIVYALLPEDGSLTAADLHRRLEGFAGRYVPPEAAPQGMDIRFRAMPVTAVSQAWFDAGIGAISGVSLVDLLYALGILTLLVGCVNFANLSAAEAFMRGREVGLRKAIGARRSQVAAQVFAESALQAGLALLAAAPISALAAAALSSRLYLDISLPGADRLDYWAGVAAIAAGAAVAAGLYPALALANLRPAFAIRTGSARGGSSGVRTLLIGSQFAIAGFLLAMVAVMLMQTAGLRRMLLPGDDGAVVSIRVGPFDLPAQDNGDFLEAIRQDLLASPAVVSVTYSLRVPFSTQATQVSEYARSPEPGATAVTAQARQVYLDYFSTMGVEVLAGRTFARDRNEDDAVVVDAATAALLGYSPAGAIGEPIYTVAASNRVSGSAAAPLEESRIIGVVAHEPLELQPGGPKNYAYQLTSRAPSVALIRLSDGQDQAGVAHIRDVWERRQLDSPPSPVFLSQYLENNTRSLSVVTRVMAGLCAIAIAIAAMGLFGLASFVAQRRVREIGVRKTLGASTGRAMRLLLWDFSGPVFVANLVAWPFAFIAARAYLDLFVARIDLTPAPFLIALAVSLAVCWLAAGSHAWRAARVKPASVLKHE